MRNFIPERMVRATGRFMRMNIDDGDVFIGEFANGALCSIQTSFVTVGNYPGIEARIYGSKGALICRMVEEGGRGGNAARGDARRGRIPRARGAGALLPPRRDARGIVAHALLRQSDQQLHRRNPERRQRNEGGFEDGAWVQEVINAVEQSYPGAAGGVVAAARMTALAGFFESYYRLRPVNATFTGIHDHDDRLPIGRPRGSTAA
jgi:predicted dehydrogenase